MNTKTDISNVRANNQSDELASPVTTGAAVTDAEAKLHRDALWEATPDRRRLITAAYPDEKTETLETFYYFFEYLSAGGLTRGNWQLVKREEIGANMSPEERAIYRPRWIRRWKKEHGRQQARQELYSLVFALKRNRTEKRFDTALLFAAEKAIVRLAKIGDDAMRKEYGLKKV